MGAVSAAGLTEEDVTAWVAAAAAATSAAAFREIGIGPEATVAASTAAVEARLAGESPIVAAKAAEAAAKATQDALDQGGARRCPTHRRR